MDVHFLRNICLHFPEFNTQTTSLNEAFTILLAVILPQQNPYAHHPPTSVDHLI